MPWIAPQDAALSVPPGEWAVGVSGGADSVALLLLLRARPDFGSRLSLHVAHLDHETRGEASAGDARFVAELAGRLGIPCTVARWRDVEHEVPARVKNVSARFRAGRRVLFRNVVAANGLDGIILAHHADDQAETVFLRLLKRPGVMGLAGMAERSGSSGVVVLRPLLRTRREALGDWLRNEGQPWREDASNASGKYLRNRVRRVLAARPDLTEALLETAETAGGLAEWVRRSVPPGTDKHIEVTALRNLPRALARELARRWLVEVGAPPGELAAEVLDRLLEMAADAASPARSHFPGGVFVRRRGGRLFVEGGEGDSRPRRGPGRAR
jgi:tRNA(Ile)-lysidine synthase